MAGAYGTRINDDTNFITTIDLDDETCETTGHIDGEAVDFSGGGGSSDFTTAEVTILGWEDVNFYEPPIVIQDGELLASPPLSYPDADTFVLYNGKQMLVIAQKMYPIENVETTGDISVEFDEEASLYNVTIAGNGTITITTQIA